MQTYIAAPLHAIKPVGNKQSPATGIERPQQPGELAPQRHAEIPERSKLAMPYIERRSSPQEPLAPAKCSLSRGGLTLRRSKEGLIRRGAYALAANREALILKTSIESLNECQLFKCPINARIAVPRSP